MQYSKKLYNIWAPLHIVFIVLICCHSTYSKYCRFNKIKQSKAVTATTGATLYNAPLMLYGYTTGAGTGYGFFAPSIRSNGVIMGECGGQPIMPKFNSFEGAVRFSSLATAVTDYLLNGNEDSTATGVNSTSIAYYDLILKSIGIAAYKQNHCTQDSFLISYNIINFPELADYRRGEHDYYFTRIKELKLKLK